MNLGNHVFVLANQLGKRRREMFEFIKKKAEEKGVTMYWLAGKMGVRRNKLYNLNNQRDITLSFAIKIADALDMSLDEFRNVNK